VGLLADPGVSRHLSLVSANERAYFNRYGWPDREHLSDADLALLAGVEDRALRRRRQRRDRQLWRDRQREGAQRSHVSG
jgi:hypothetical protein